MKKIIIIVSLFLPQFIYSQTLVNKFELLGTFQYENISGLGGSDVWGWTADDGTEYALMGVFEGIAIVNATTLEKITIVSGPQETEGNARINWRDIKTYKHYAYVVSESRGANEGLMVIDLQFLPDSVKYIGSFPIDTSGSVRSHNISIDTSSGFAYVVNNTSSPMSIFDLTDPESPTFVNEFGDRYMHDIFVRDDTLYSSDAEAGTFTIWDVSDKINPTIMLRVEIPGSGYFHNIWPTDDSKFVVTTEETSGKTVKLWDISDYNDVRMVGEWLGVGALAHNAHIIDEFVFVSHYADGAYVLDISDRINPINFGSIPIEIDQYKTFLQGDGGYGGWGIYPYTQNGMVFASDFSGKLTILKIKPVKSLIGSLESFYALPDTGIVHITIIDNLTYDSLTALVVESETAHVDTFPLGYNDFSGFQATFFGDLMPNSGEHWYTVNIEATNSNWIGDDSGRIDFFSELARFTTIGPVVYDGQDSISVNNNKYIFKVMLANNGSVTTANAIRAKISTSDTCATSYKTSEVFYRDIAAGANATPLFKFTVDINSICASTEELLIPFDIEISSERYVYWTDSFVLVVPPGIGIGVEDEITGLPTEYALSNAYPNPFNPTTTIEYSLPQSGDVSLIIYNLTGQEVTRLVSEVQQAGYHQVTWNAANVPSGIYFYRLQAGDFVQTKKIVLLK